MTFKPGQSGNPKGRTPGRRNAKTRAVLEKLNGASLARPGKNATGTTGLTIDLTGKRLEVLKEIAPAPTHIGFVSMQKGISASLDQVDQTKFDAAAATAKALGLTIAWRPLPNSRDVDALFASIMANGDEAPYVVFDPLTI